jgi:hypothetical protein
MVMMISTEQLTHIRAAAALPATASTDSSTARKPNKQTTFSCSQES